MTDFLLFTVYAPLASWGEIAVGEVRGTWDRPSRSALLGMVAAALGITRDDQGAHDALDSGYGVAVRLDAPGAQMVDYHTAQTVPASIVKKLRPTTRAALLAAGDPQTTLSRREYRQDALATVALWARARARWSLEEIAAGLRQPAFVLYAGRKANTLGLPLDPTVVAGATLADAFAQIVQGPGALAAELLRPAEGWGREVAHDPCDDFAAGLRPLRRATRRDTAAHRGRWQFAERVVEIGEIAPQHMSAPSPAGAEDTR